MMVVSRYIPPGLGPAYRLKEFIGAKWAFLRTGEHPLGAGREALDKFLLGREGLGDAERIAFGQFKQFALVVDRARRYWEPHAGRFHKDVLTADTCRSLLFETQVIYACIEPNVRSHEWPIYTEGHRDIRTNGPDVWVECKSTNRVSFGRIMKRIREAKAQPRPEGIPFVVAVGFDSLVSKDDVYRVEAEAREMMTLHGGWPELTGILVLMQTAEPTDGVDWNPLHLRGRNVVCGNVLEIRNQGGACPLPKNFSFGGQTGAARLFRQN